MITEQQQQEQTKIIEGFGQQTEPIKMTKPYPKVLT
jgi:hypothetical protein